MFISPFFLALPHRGPFFLFLTVAHFSVWTYSFQRPTASERRHRQEKQLAYQNPHEIPHQLHNEIPPQDEEIELNPNENMNTDNVQIPNEGEGDDGTEGENGEGEAGNDEGEDGDDRDNECEEDQSFLEGPIDPYILSTYKTYVAAEIWLGNEKGVLSMKCHTQKLREMLDKNGVNLQVFRRK